MTTTRIVLATFAAFLLANVFAGTIHGFILANDYAPYYGTLSRSADGPAWRFIFLPVAHLAVIGGLMWIYTHLRLAGSATAQGLKLGVLAWVMGQVPVWLLWYAQQPWPGSLLVQQLGLHLAS